MEKKDRKKHRKHSGSTMVELLVAFVVVLMILAAFGKAFTVSVNLLSRSRTMVEQNENFNAKYYKTAEQSKRDVVTGSLRLFKEDTMVLIPLKIPLKGELNVYSSGGTGTSDTAMKRYSVSLPPTGAN